MNKALAAKLRQLKARDEDTRAALLAADRLYGKYDESMQAIHRENAAALDDIVEEYGWPGTELVGEDGCRAAWLIAQHSICTPDLQRKFLGLLEEAAKRGDVPPRQVAMLTDRIRFNEDRPQVYGTVFDWDENGEFGCRVQDRDGLEQRRKEAGLCPYAEALQLNRQAVEAEGGKPPPDYAAYRHGFLDWAAKAGWRKAD